MNKNNNILKFSNLSKFDSLIHGFSTRFFGDMRPTHPEYKDSLQKFSAALNIDPQKLVTMKQVHSNTVYWATDKNYDQAIKETDGLLTEEKDLFLGVVSADCIPLLFYDPKMQFVAAVHAGWRGLFSEIIKETVSQFVSKGSNASDIIVGMGPSIRVCCYAVSEEFVENFREKFEAVEKFIVRKDGKIFIDLQKVAKEQLQSLGVLDQNVEDADYCTFDHSDVYSYRREGENFGEMIGIIGIL
jgi:hypothetical protein